MSGVWVIKMSARLSLSDAMPNPQGSVPRSVLSTNPYAMEPAVAKAKEKDEFREFRISYFPEDGTMAVFEIFETVATRKITVKEIVPRSIHLDRDTGKPYHGLYFKVGAKLHLPDGIKDGLALPYREFVITSVPDDLEVLQNYLRNPPAGHAPFEEPPHEEKSRAEKVLDRVRARIRTRTGAAPGENLQLAKLAKHFRILDDSGDGRLSIEEIDKALTEYGIDLSLEEMSIIREEMDKNHDGFISYEEFLSSLRGPLNERRREIVRKAFLKLDANKNGVIEIDDVAKFYSGKMNPLVLSGQKTETDVLKDFLSTFEGGPGQKDGKITFGEFLATYEGISANIDNDDHFIQLVKKAWTLHDVI